MGIYQRPHLRDSPTIRVVRQRLTDPITKSVLGHQPLPAFRHERFRAGGKVDLVFSDIQMPGVLDGRQLAELIARDHPGIPVILTSGDIQLGAGLPTGLFVAKPYRIPHTVTLFYSVLGLLPPEGSS